MVRSYFTIWLINRMGKYDGLLALSIPARGGVSVQGRHTGQRLTECYCVDVDRAGQMGYLETDQAENVEFYRRFGFELTNEASVLGVPNFYMRRAARAGSTG